MKREFGAIVVRARARLHLGLVKISDDPGFISAGITIQHPFSQIKVCCTKHKQCGGFAQRDVERAKRLVGTVREYKAESIISIPRHEGFGSGTRRALSIASAIMKLEKNRTSIYKTAEAMGRGERSMMGSLLFDKGGAAVDCGGTITCYKIPQKWRVIVIKPKMFQRERKIFGVIEDQRFEKIKPLSGSKLKKFKDELSHTLVQGLASGNFKLFSNGICLLQKLAILQFGHLQVGSASTEMGKELLAQLKEQGFMAAGQSSWGPTLFVIIGNSKDGARIIDWLETTGKIESATMTRISRSGMNFS
tara:strand:- start:5310 stop:6224 length:915 start_codon:yes stop_codon:yes gene_type:complete